MAIGKWSREQGDRPRDAVTQDPVGHRAAPALLNTVPMRKMLIVLVLVIAVPCAVLAVSAELLAGIARIF